MSTEIKWQSIRSKYILGKIFDLMPKIKMLNIIRYNQNLKKALNIEIEDYKECGIIEIEIPSDNINGKFISIEEENSPYYHIYFNDNENETEKRHISKYDKIHKIKIIIDYQIESLKGLFTNCEEIEKIEFTNAIDKVLLI